jgi:hypothetical protein
VTCADCHRPLLIRDGRALMGLVLVGKAGRFCPGCGAHDEPKADAPAAKGKR